MKQIDKDVLAEIVAFKKNVITEIQKAFMGEDTIPLMLLTALIAKGHVLLEGVPGVAKTTLVRSFAAALGSSFSRIQFTPDLLPADITGTFILDMRTNTFILRKGPVFANIVLGDEINRAPAKTQSALLEAMQEAQVTIEGQTHRLEEPFLVLATQNPIEQEGTYPLPEAQIDRFMLKLEMGYPKKRTEKEMLLTYGSQIEEINPVIDIESMIRVQSYLSAVQIDEELIDYILELAHFTREHKRVYLGVSPRASLMMLHAAKAFALLSGRNFVLPDDIKILARPLFAHRIILSPEADLEGVLGKTIVTEALNHVRYQKRS